MNSTFGKIILGNVFRNALTALIVFFVTKHVIQADVASKLMRGDTTELYPGSGISINLAMIINVLVGVSLPIVVPIALGVWSRVTAAYETLVARSQSFAVSKTQLKAIADQASPIEKISAVVTQTPVEPTS